MPEALVLHQEHWHPGVVGLVATRVLDKFYRPVLVFGTVDGKLKGVAVLLMPLIYLQL